MAVDASRVAELIGGAPPEVHLPKDSEQWNLHAPAYKIDPRDVDTPDNWVPRHASMSRNTGRHPFNSEAPIDELMAAGFITPVSLHIVRNHGAVPKLDWKTHRIEIGGMVEKPMSISMDELIKFKSITVPCTVTCAGNRRKEENTIKRTVGFDWGASATSCTYWTGVRLCDILRHVKAKGPSEGARYVCFRGPLGELPQGEDGSYGTSMTLSHAMDPANDVILAFKQNGRWLTPDHGFPVRMLIPGFIGGRMVKWLSEITVTAVETNNHYHYFDNRVLPPHVDKDIAKEEGWWYKPDYIINELNINSAVARPWHDEVILLRENKPYTITGYAYTGGGRFIIRCEVSLDDGQTWRQANIRRFEKPNPYGKYWSWVFWDLNVSTFEFTQCDELLVRAWDSSQNGQPEHITWNVMGMMNNCYFRIQIHPYTSGNSIGLRFQHPAPLYEGNLDNKGWREKLDCAPPVVEAKPAVKAETPKAENKYSMDEIRQHDNEDSCWFVRDGKVYDATPFLEDHPGGADSILLVAGEDATVEFDAVHSAEAKKQLEDYYIGDVKQ